MRVKVVGELAPEILFQLLERSSSDSGRRLENPSAVSAAPTGKSIVFYPQQLAIRNYLGPRVHREASEV
jgi:hypothetical protein